MAMKGKKTKKLYSSTPAAPKVKRSSFGSIGEDIEADISEEHTPDLSNDQPSHSEPLVVRNKKVLMDWIHEAIIALGEPKKGSSFSAIKKWIFSNKGADPGKTLAHLKKALLSDLNDGNLTRAKSTKLCHGVTGSFLLVKEAKQPAALKNKTKDSKKAENPKTKVPKADKQGVEHSAPKQTKEAKLSKVQKAQKMPAVKTGTKARVSLNASKITAKPKAPKAKVPKAAPKSKSKDAEASPIEDEDEEGIPEAATESKLKKSRKVDAGKGSKTATSLVPKSKPTKNSRKKDVDSKDVPKSASEISDEEEEEEPALQKRVKATRTRATKNDVPKSVSGISDEEEDPTLQKRVRATHTRATKKDELEEKDQPKGSGRAAESKPRIMKETAEPKLVSSDTKPKTAASKAAGLDGKPKNRIARARNVNLEVTMSRKDRDLSDTELSVKPNIFQTFNKSCASDTEVEKVNKAERSMKVIESRSRKANAAKGKTKTNSIM